VGYGLSALLMPIALVTGPNLLDALPAIVLVNVLLFYGPIEFEIDCELPDKYVRKDEFPAQNSDVAVTGFDDVPVARHLHPPLTTVRQPMQELGARAFEALYSRINAGAGKPDIVLPVQLVVRESCGCAPNLSTLSGTTPLTMDGR